MICKESSRHWVYVITNLSSPAKPLCMVCPIISIRASQIRNFLSAHLRNISHLPNSVCSYFDCVDPNKQWEILKEMGIPDRLYLPPEKFVCSSIINS